MTPCYYCEQPRGPKGECCQEVAEAQHEQELAAVRADLAAANAHTLTAIDERLAAGRVIDALRARVAELEASNASKHAVMLASAKQCGELRARVAELEGGLAALLAAACASEYRVDDTALEQASAILAVPRGPTPSAGDVK